MTLALLWQCPAQLPSGNPSGNPSAHQGEGAHARPSALLNPRAVVSCQHSHPGRRKRLSDNRAGAWEARSAPAGVSEADPPSEPLSGPWHKGQIQPSHPCSPSQPHLPEPLGNAADCHRPGGSSRGLQSLSTRGRGCSGAAFRAEQQLRELRGDGVKEGNQEESLVQLVWYLLALRQQYNTINTGWVFQQCFQLETPTRLVFGTKINLDISMHFQCLRQGITFTVCCCVEYTLTNRTFTS